MSEHLHWRTEGEGLDLILIHGWGMNTGVWQQILPLLTPHFRVHCVDLPGYGHSASLKGQSIEDLARTLLNKAPSQAIWLGWSLGGLVAMKAALLQGERLGGLITVATSPCFLENEEWKGVKPSVLENFASQLADNLPQTIERFMALQALGSKNARHDIKTLKQHMLDKPLANEEALKLGLKSLQEEDFRQDIANISVPWLRLYGGLDALVPYQSIPDVDILAPQSHAHVFPDTSHAPFISAPQDFVVKIDDFCHFLRQ